MKHYLCSKLHRMKKIFVIDWALIPALLLTVLSGIKLHVTGHSNSYEIWHNWSVVHILISGVFLFVCFYHIKMHWGWYKSLFRKKGKKSHITVFLSLVFLIVTLSGIASLIISGNNSGIGMWHYRIGLLMCAVAVGHLIKRWKILKKSL